LLAGGDFLFVESGVALQVELRILQIRFVPSLFRQRLIKRCLIGPRINLREKFTFADLCPCRKATLVISPSTRLRTVTVS